MQPMLDTKLTNIPNDDTSMISKAKATSLAFKKSCSSLATTSSIYKAIRGGSRAKLKGGS